MTDSDDRSPSDGGEPTPTVLDDLLGRALGHPADPGGPDGATAGPAAPPGTRPPPRPGPRSRTVPRRRRRWAPRSPARVLASGALVALLGLALAWVVRPTPALEPPAPPEPDPRVDSPEPDPRFAEPERAAAGDRDGPGPGPAVPAGERRRGQDRPARADLDPAHADVLPPEVLGTCAALGPDGGDAALVCTPEGLAGSVEYRWISDPTARDEAHEAVAGAQPSGTGPAGCAAGATEVRRWADPGSPDVPAGRYACVVAGDGSAALWWTVDAIGLLGVVRSVDGDLAGLFDWWRRVRETRPGPDRPDAGGDHG